MKFAILQENLLSALKKLTKVIEARPSIAVLGHVLIEAKEGAVFLSATNLNVTIQLKVGGRIDKEGACTVPYKPLLTAISKLPKERIDIEVHMEPDQRLTLSGFTWQCGSRKGILDAGDITEYPALPKLPATQWFSVSNADLKDAIRHTIFCSTEEDNRPVLTTERLQFAESYLRIAAADGFRLAEQEIKLSMPPAPFLSTPPGTTVDINVPAQTMRILYSILPKIDKVAIYPAPKDIRIFFFMPEMMVCSSIVEGKYPAVESVIPTQHNVWFTVHAKDLAGQIELSMPRKNMDYDQTVEIELASDEKHVGIYSKTYSGQIDAAIKGLRIACPAVYFNAQYLLDFLKTINEEYVTIRLVDKSHPMVLLPADRGDITWALMPCARSEPFKRV